VHWGDIVITVVVGLFVFKGLVKGFIREFLGFVGFIIAFLLGTNSMENGANILLSVISIPYPLAQIVSYFIIFMIVLFFIRFIAKSITKLMKETSLGWLNRAGGAAFGFIFGVLLLSIIIAFLNMPVISERLNLEDKWNSMMFYPFVEQFAPETYDLILKFFPTGKSFYEKFMSDYADSLKEVI